MSVAENWIVHSLKNNLCNTYIWFRPKPIQCGWHQWTNELDWFDNNVKIKERWCRRVEKGSYRSLRDTCCCRVANFCFSAAITSHRSFLSIFLGTHLLMRKARAVKWEWGREEERLSEQDTVNVFLHVSEPRGILLQPFRRSSSRRCFDLFFLGSHLFIVHFMPPCPSFKVKRFPSSCGSLCCVSGTAV